MVKDQIMEPINSNTSKANILIILMDILDTSNQSMIPFSLDPRINMHTAKTTAMITIIFTLEKTTNDVAIDKTIFVN